MFRYIIYAQDIVFILGKSETYARELIRTMKTVYQKEPHQYISIKEFCDYMDFPYDEILNMIQHRGFKPT